MNILLKMHIAHTMYTIYIFNHGYGNYNIESHAHEYLKSTHKI